MLKIGIIGCGNRVTGMAKRLRVFKIPYKVTAGVDPRAEEIKAAGDELYQDTRFYDDPDEMLENEDLDGIMIGTRCDLHTPMAIKAAKRNLPIFLEKPVAVTYDQVAELESVFKRHTAPVVVSFPLRTSPIAERVKELVASGEIGDVAHVVAFNDVPYAACYYRGWYRDFDTTQGLFLQKATHDFDCVNFLLGQRPQIVCAMKAQHVYGGSKPFDLKCMACDEREECVEGPWRRFLERYEGDSVNWNERDMCMFAEGVRNEDTGNAIIEYDNCVQLSYTQNFLARGGAGRRGARLYGHKGTIEFDWRQNHIKLFYHHRPGTATIDFSSGNMSHFGGDDQLCHDFLMAMRDGAPGRAPIEAGILSALTCLCAKESAETRRFVEVKLPKHAAQPAGGSG